MQKPSVLFVSHVADRNGAPLLLLGIIKEFRKISGMPFRILLMKDGELTSEFEDAGPVHTWRQRPVAQSASLLARALAYGARFITKWQNKYMLYRLKGTGVVFYNTIANGQVHGQLLPLHAKSVYYVHELGAAIHSQTNAHTLGTILKHTDLFLAVSEAVKNNLTQQHGLDARKVKVLYPSLPEVYRQKEKYKDFTGSFRNKHRIPEDAVVIGLMAANEWRKGFDLLLPLAKLYYNLYPNNNVYFVWKGFREKNRSGFYDLYDYEKFQLCDRVLLLPHDNQSIEQMACFDIHLLLSREDPYPLVVLEAASFGIPTVCFSDAGGMPEFIEQDCGYCVPYGDLLKMANSLHELASDAGLRMSMGKNAQEKVRARHNQQEATREVVKIIDHLINPQPSGSIKVKYLQQTH